MTSPLLTSHLLLLLLPPLKRPSFTQQQEGDFPPASPTPVIVRTYKKVSLIGRLLPFFCLAHWIAYGEAVINVKTKFVGANKAEPVDLANTTCLHTGWGGADVATAGY